MAIPELRPTAQQFAVEILAPHLSQEEAIGRVAATRLLSTDPRAEAIWAAVNKTEGAPDARTLDQRVPLLTSSWRTVLPQLQRAAREKEGRFNADNEG